MDKNLLKFWGNMFQQAAESQERIEEMTRWLNDGLKGSTLFMDMFKDYLKAGVPSGKKDDMPDDQELYRVVRKNFETFLDMFGMVSKSEHTSLAKKYEELKKTVSQQKETIDHLRTMLDGKESSSQNSLKMFQDMAEKQTEQFSSLMNSFSSFYKNQIPKKKDDK